MEEPTFTSLGLDPDIFMRFFRSLEQQPEGHLGHDQRRFEEGQGAGLDHGQDDRSGAVPDHITQQIHQGESGVTSGAVVAGGVGDTIGGGGILTVEPTALVEPSNTAAVVPEDVDMA